jgi:hypothetical protein
MKNSARAPRASARVSPLLALLMTSTLGLVACGGGDGADGASGLIAALRSSTAPPGANCPAGGTRLQAGADTNRNGLLEDSEVTTTTFVCNGPNVSVRQTHIDQTRERA